MGGRSGTPVEGPGWLRDRLAVRAPLLVRELPPEVAFGFLGRVAPTTDRIDVRIEAHRILPDRALEIVHGARAVAEAELLGSSAGTETSAYEVVRASAAELGERVARREEELWKVGVCFSTSAASASLAETLRARLERRLAALGFRPHVPRFESSAALRPPDLTGTAPRPLGYWHTLPTGGVAAFYPFVDETVAEPGGVLVGLTLDDAAPIFLDRWAHSSHSWGVFGTTGSGKTFAAALLALRTLWFRRDLDLTILDPLGEFAGFARALGGSVLSLGVPSGARLNPLDPVTAGGDRTEKAARVGAMLRALFPSLRDEEAATLDAVVSRLYGQGPAVPTVGDLVRSVGEDPNAPSRLATLLEVFRTGSLASVDGPTTVAPGAGPVVVSFQGVPEDHLPFHLTYVLDWAYGRLRRRAGPKLLVVDEAHLLTRHGATAEFLDRVVRHVRHFDAGLLLLSQAPDDFLDQPSGRSVLRNLRATFLLRLPHVSDAAAEFFGLTLPEREWLPRARLPREAGYSEGLLRAGGSHLPLAVIASTPEYEFLRSALEGDPRGREPPAAPATRRL